MSLNRELGVFGAMMMGLGSIIGTGVFVSIGLAAGVAGPVVLIAIALAAAVATCNGLSSAQLAANHPVSGGTYEYGYRYLNPVLGSWRVRCFSVPIRLRPPRRHWALPVIFSISPAKAHNGLLPWQSAW
jgi:amino acid transporter